MRTRARIRRLWMLALLLLGSNLILATVFYIVALTHAAAGDPTFGARYEEIRQVYYPDSSLQSEAEMQRFFEALQPLFVSVDWFRVALVASALAFGLIGLVAGRLNLDPRWIGALPLATMLSGPNPAVFPTFLENQGLPGHHLELWQQVVVFGSQMVILYVTAIAWRSQPTSKPPSPP